MFVTLGLTVFVDLITAVAVGLILAGFVTARWMEREEIQGLSALALKDDPTLTDEERQALEEHDGAILLVSLRGRFSYASAREITKRVGVMTAGYKAFILDLSAVGGIDTSAAMAIEELINAVQDQGIKLFVSGLSGDAEATLNALEILATLKPEQRATTKSIAIQRASSALKAA